MRRKMLEAGLAALVWGCSTTLVTAQQLGTEDEARAMLNRAIAALKSSEVAALSKFNDENNKQFHDRDLYVFCFNMSDGKVTSYSAPFLIGADVRTLTLINDPIGQRAYDAVRNIPDGKIAILQYKFPKPGTTEPATKLSFETRIGDQGCGVTYYQ
jgi:signal transduction histidine kinase